MKNILNCVAATQEPLKRTLNGGIKFAKSFSFCFGTWQLSEGPRRLPRAPTNSKKLKDTKKSRTWWCFRAPHSPIMATRNRKMPTPMTPATTLMLETRSNHFPQAPTPISSRLTNWGGRKQCWHERGRKFNQRQLSKEVSTPETSDCASWRVDALYQLAEGKNQHTLCWSLILMHLFLSARHPD